MTWYNITQNGRIILPIMFLMLFSTRFITCCWRNGGEKSKNQNKLICLIILAVNLPEYFWQKNLRLSIKFSSYFFLSTWYIFGLDLLIERFAYCYQWIGIKVENLANMLDNLGRKTAKYFWQEILWSPLLIHSKSDFIPLFVEFFT